MKTFTQENLHEHLQKLGVKAGDDLLIHCGMFAFGPFEGGEDGLFKSLLSYLGDKSTIVVPTFTLWMEPEQVYTRSTPSQRMGQFAEYIRQQPNATRSRCPMHNHAAIGPKANLLNDYPGKHSTGPGSDFELFYGENFKNLFLGCTPKESGTFLIHAEAMANVPYREWIDIFKKVQWDNEPATDLCCKYYARRSNLPEFNTDSVGVSVDLGILQALLLEQGIFIEEKLPYGRSFFGAIRDIQDTVTAALIESPYLTLVSHDDNQ